MATTMRPDRSATARHAMPWEFARALTFSPVDRLSTTTMVMSSAVTLTPATNPVLAEWVAAAVREATVSIVDGYHVAEVPGIPEAWMDGETAAEALGALPAVLLDWAELAIEGGQTLPTFGGVDPNP